MVSCIPFLASQSIFGECTLGLWNPTSFQPKTVDITLNINTPMKIISVFHFKLVYLINFEQLTDFNTWSFNVSVSCSHNMWLINLRLLQRRVAVEFCKTWKKHFNNTLKLHIYLHLCLCCLTWYSNSGLLVSLQANQNT